MAYNRAPRFITDKGNQVSPNSYEISYDAGCWCKGSNWAPFLSSATHRTKPATTTSPAPNAYHPNYPNRIIGGSSLRYTASRFTKTTEPPPTIDEKAEEPEKPEEENPPRLKGYMYHCNVPYTLLGYPPTIPNANHFGYKILEDKTMVECCDPKHDTTIGPAFYHVNYGTFGTVYRGSYWSRYSKRKFIQPSDVPGVGTYNVDRQPNEQEFLNKLRLERKKNAKNLRYIDNLQDQAKRNNYPSPNSYLIKEIEYTRKNIKLVPKKLIREKKIRIQRWTTPAPNQYNDPRTALSYLVKPSFKKGHNAFLTNAPRFPEKGREIKPAPNEYVIKGFVEQMAAKVSPFAVRNTAFDTSVPKKLYYLPPEYPLEEIPESPKKPKPRPVHPFASTTKRLPARPETYNASCASYNIREAFLYMNAKRSFRKAARYNFLVNEKRLAPLTNGKPVDDNGKTPGVLYNVAQVLPLPQKGISFGTAKRFSIRRETLPGPSDYCGPLQKPTRTFNVTLRGSNPLTPFQAFRIRTKYNRNVEADPRKSVKKADEDSECPEVQNLEIEFYVKPYEKLPEKKIP